MSQGILVALTALVAWANWQEPDLHSFARSVRLVILKVHGLQSGSKAVDLQDRTRHLAGVTACTLATVPGAQIAAVTYRPEEITETEIRHSLSAGDYLVTPVQLPAPAVVKGPQCPVPATWVLRLEQLRFALNFRRFLVRV